MSEIFSSCRMKQQKVKDLFSKCGSSEEMYRIIIDLGKKQVPFPPEEKTAERLVRGCQSRTFLKSWEHDGKCMFAIESDALISAGLGQLLVMIYSGESPEVVIKCSPTCLEELGIVKSLSQSRSEGLSSMLARMRIEAIKMVSEPIHDSQIS